MGRIYSPVEVSYNGRKEIVVALVDTGADRTVVSERLASRLEAELYGAFLAACASQTILEGKYADFIIKDIRSSKQASIEVGVSDIPFDTDDINDEGLEVILGVDFIQMTGLKIGL